MTEHAHDHSHDLNVKKVDRLSPTKVRLTLEFSGESVSNHEKAMTKKYVAQAKIPGFRPGKAPVTMIKDKFKDEIQRDVVSHLLEAGLMEALQKTNLMPLNRPKVEMGKFDAGKPFEFNAEFEVEPEIELKKYKGIPLKKADVKVEDSEIEKTFDNLRDRMATLEEHKAEKAEKGNFAVVEVALEMKDGSKKEEPKNYTVEVGMEKLLPNIDKALLEMAVGETRSVDEVFPKDYQDKNFAGKEVTYHVKLLELKKKVLPELNDAFAGQLKEGATLEQIRTEITENIKRGKEQDAERNQRQDIVEYLIKNNGFEVPVSLIEAQSRQLLQWMENDLKKSGRKLNELTDADLKSVKERAENMVRSSMLLKEVAVKENIKLDDQRVQAKIDGIAASMGRPVEEAKKYLEGKDMLNRLNDEVLTDQVFEFLVSQAKVS